jgi:hypothetical protein
MAVAGLVTDASIASIFVFAPSYVLGYEQKLSAPRLG